MKAHGIYRSYGPKVSGYVVGCQANLPPSTWHVHANRTDARVKGSWKLVSNSRKPWKQGVLGL